MGASVGGAMRHPERLGVEVPGSGVSPFHDHISQQRSLEKFTSYLGGLKVTKH